MPMAYYYLRKNHGELQKIRIMPSRQSPSEQGDLNPVAWVFVNSAEGDTLDSVLDRPPGEQVQVLQRAIFKNGVMYQVHFSHSISGGT